MQIKFIKADIVRELNNAALFLKKAQQDFLQALWIRADAEKDEIVLSATDSHAEYTARIKATVVSPGMVGVNGRVFVELIKKMEQGEIAVKANKKLSVFQGKKRYSLPLMNDSWYQENEQMPKRKVVLAADLLKESIEKVAFCINPNSLEQDAMNCLFFGQREGEVKIVGLDGSMMAIQSLTNDALSEILDEDVLINKAMVDELKKILPVSGQVEVAVSEKRLFVRIGGDGEETVSFPRVKHEYPNFMNLLENYNTPLFTVSLNKSEVLEALGRLSLFNTDIQSVQFDFKKGKVILSSRDCSVGDAVEEIECNYSGKKFSILFNLPGLQKILKYFASEKVKFCPCGSTEPCFFKGDEDVGYMSLIMPIEVEEDSYEERNEAKE